MHTLVDAHCHLNSPLFAGRLDAVLARAHAAGVTRVVVPAWDEESAHRALALAEAYPGIYPAVGLHPWFADAVPNLDWLPALLDHPAVIAVGEIGIDTSAATDPALQEEVYRAQLTLAAERDLPIVLHAHRGWDRLLAGLYDFPTVRGVAHAFSASREVLDLCVRRGLYISFAGMVTRRNSRRAHEAAQHVPLDRLLLETDAPYMAMKDLPAEHSEPACLTRVLDFVAALRGESADHLVPHLWHNAQTLFRWRSGTIR
jgi:TatD DNase family protein